MKNILHSKWLIGIMVVVVGLPVFFILIADSLVKKGIETAGTRVIGARVELDKADLSFFPAGLEITRMQVTNPDAPMKNAVDISRIAFDMHLVPLLQKKIISDEMAVEGVRFDTDRKTSGAVPGLAGKAKKDAEMSVFKLPSLDIADVKTILEKEPLQTIEETERLKQQIAEERSRFEKQLKELPDKEKLRQYEDRIEALKGKRGIEEILGAAGQVNSIQKDIRDDLARIHQARDDVRNSIARLREQAEKVARSPYKDFQRLKEKYSLTPEGMGHMAALLFGPEYGQWVETGLAWYQRLGPLLDSGESEQKEAETSTVQDRKAEPLPYFLVRRAAVSVVTPAGEISGAINNMTNRQHILGRPMTFVLSSKQMKNIEAININGELDHINAQSPKDEMTVSARGMAIRDFKISSSNDFPLALTSATADWDISTVIESVNLKSKANFDLSKAQFSSNPEKELNKIGQALIDKLSGTSRFNLTAVTEGTIGNFSMNIDSNIDNVIKDTLTAVVGKTTAQFEARLKSAVLEKTNGPVGALGDNIAGLNPIEQELNERLRIGQALGFTPQSLL